MHRLRKRRWPRRRYTRDWQTIWWAKRFTLKQSINLLIFCRFWAQRILMKCRQEFSDSECVSCDLISLFLLSLIGNSQPLMRCHVHPPSLRPGQARGGDRVLRREHSTSAASLGSAFRRNCHRTKGTPNLQKALWVLQRGIARLDSKVSKLAHSIMEFKRRDLLGTRTSSQRPLSHYSVIDKTGNPEQDSRWASRNC